MINYLFVYRGLGWLEDSVIEAVYIKEDNIFVLKTFLNDYKYDNFKTLYSQARKIAENKAGIDCYFSAYVYINEQYEQIDLDGDKI
jgi:hypothetical protein